MIPTTDSTDRIQTAFLAHLPRFRAHTQFALRHIVNPDDRADLQAEALALAWRHFVELSRRGKAPETFVTVLALRCTQAVRAGRRLAGGESGQDVLSRTARARHGFELCRLGEGKATIVRRLEAEDEHAEALIADTRTPVPDQAAFRLDFPAWRAGLRRRERAIADALAAGERTNDVARRFGLSKSRVSQLRRTLQANWEAFHEPVGQR